MFSVTVPRQYSPRRHCKQSYHVIIATEESASHAEAMLTPGALPLMPAARLISPPAITGEIRHTPARGVRAARYARYYAVEDTAYIIPDEMHLYHNEALQRKCQVGIAH